MLKLSHIKLRFAGLLLVSAVAFLMFSGSSHAASFNVAAGNDELDANSTCSLSEAIYNINYQDNTDYPECPAGDGNNDEIILPSGTITLTDDLQTIDNSVIITGQGMGVSIVDAAGLYSGFYSNAAGDFSIQGLTIKGFQDFAIDTNRSNVVVTQVELDGNGVTMTSNSAIFGIRITNDSASTSKNVNLSNIYAHNLNANAPQLFTIALALSSADTTISAQMNNITVADISATGQVSALMIGSGYFGSASGVLNATIQNLTVSGPSSSADNTGGLLVGAMVLGGAVQSDVTVYLNNATFTGMRSNVSQFIPGYEGRALSVAAAAMSAGSIANTSLITRNVVLYDNISSGNKYNCGAEDIGSFFGSPAGTSNLAFTSQGGNLSDDTTCNPYFTHASDQNNLGNLASTLGTLSNNGGYVPTIPLLEGSPAIDAGVDVSGLTTDARLAVRPQGSAFDSGAYESPFTKASEGAAAASLAGTGGNVATMAALSLITVILGSFVIFKSRFMLQ